MIGYVDGRRGISGGSLLAALIDAGADVDEVAAHLPFLSRDQKLHAEQTIVDGLRACRVQLDDPDERVAQGPRELLAAIAEVPLPRAVRDGATDVYRRLAAAEARAHGLEPDGVRFEELASRRSVVGVVGSAIALTLLGIDRVAASPLPFGGGDVTTHHGRLPLPAPATLELLRGIPVEPQDVTGELVTPTGAALVASLASSFGEIPAMTIEAVGIGSDGAALVTRIVVGRA